PAEAAHEDDERRRGGGARGPRPRRTHGPRAQAAVARLVALAAKLGKEPVAHGLEARDALGELLLALAELREGALQFLLFGGKLLGVRVLRLLARVGLRLATVRREAEFLDGRFGLPEALLAGGRLLGVGFHRRLELLEGLPLALVGCRGAGGFGRRLLDLGLLRRVAL